MDKYDIAVIGGGPAGYYAAIRAAQLGAKVVLFEKDTVGGTCLNRGCIPVKTLLKTAEELREIREAASRGINISGTIEVDMPAVCMNKDRVVKTLTGGVSSLLRANKIKTVAGEAELISETEISCAGEMFSADKIIICSGSEPAPLPIPGFDLPGVISSTELLELQEVLPALCIIGGGVIGCEMAEVYSSLGTEVTLIEMADRLVPAFDADICEEIRKSLEKKGVKVLTSTRTEKIETSGSQLAVTASASTVLCDRVLVCVGRRANLKCLGSLANSIKTEKGSITVDRFMRTSIPNIYACGDVNAKFMFTHAAYYMGEVAAENACGIRREADMRTVPSCMYTTPEVACIGMTEAEAKQSYGDNVRIGTYRMSGNGRAIATDNREGLVKVITDSRYGEILGVHICCSMATEIINEAQTAMEAELTIEEVVQRIVHTHPSFSEGYAEACRDVLARSIHQPPKRK